MPGTNTFLITAASRTGRRQVAYVMVHVIRQDTKKRRDGQANAGPAPPRPVLAYLLLDFNPLATNAHPANLHPTHGAIMVLIIDQGTTAANA